MSFDFKISLILVPAIMYLDKYTFYKVPYKLFLLFFRTQPDDPRHPVTQPLSLKRRPRYSRSDNILLAYSSSFRSRNPFYESLYPGFPVYLTTISSRLSFIKPLQSNRSLQGDEWMDNNLVKERFLFVSNSILNYKYKILRFQIFFKKSFKNVLQPSFVLFLKSILNYKS